ncbi:MULTISPECIES: carbohydrate ABC transporter permease [Actinotignum]|uniref:Carbohydrate ABC transporter permease n=1 Tax=Actinotignum timonense TaxID=1870995 RepID=A0AAW9HJS2_9ACTO|nr:MULTISPECIES: carbohydrate ABC transporter permease [Actinotignum]MDE1558544.1 carbohydrate ABC transporter permease [Actinotignum schaalii]MDE1663400.1 carbohydrate ABC transporter permease [Actinotignum schaalii]MDK6372708.1 carbohydrate ABC transporter permease [Actinotignum timonense]MDK6419794.1 carbohydrate ABC transporter permease [Actinotignum timonense]MDK6780833.1 carbohydrate ABC transporter permease [Actinotignum timonense]
MKLIARTTKKRHQPVTARKVAGWGLLILLIIVTVLPLLWALRTALTPNSEIFSGNYSLIPENATTINFRRVLGMTTPEESVAAGGTAATINIWLYMRNSLLFVAILVFAQVTTSTMAAYALSRLHFRGRDTLFVTLLVALMIPPIFVALPNFVLMDKLAWINTFQGLLAPYVLICPFGIFFLRQFMLSLPREVEEAAMLDGASRWTVFRKMIVPMCAAPITTLAIIQAVFGWNEYMWPQLIAKGDSVRLLNVALSVFAQSSPSTRPDWAGLMAAATLQIIPMFILLIIFGKRLVNSLGLTAAK